jgi:hypothetical protein
MFNKKLILKYESTLSNDLNSITPAKNHIPEWYKKIPQWKNNDFFNSGNFIKPTVKLCFPFLDSLTIGYMITLPYDLYVKNNNGNPILIWPRSVEGNPPGLRDYIADEKLVPFEHYAKEFTWNYYVSYSFPIGYSGILTHPLNRHDLPFTTLTGIIDGGLVMSAH